MSERSTWALVLAAGDGTRLAGVTTNDRGVVVPKQFCRLVSDETMLAITLRRARRVVAAERTLVVVAEQHRRWWEDALAAIPEENLLIQPANKGTAPGLLLPLCALSARDPEATVITFPSDHHVRDERTLEESIRAAVEVVNAGGGTVLLGMMPEAPESGYGWIVPREGGARPLPVDAFVEKPDPEAARALMRAGALQNSFLITGTVRHLLSLYDRTRPELRRAFAQALGDAADIRDTERMARLYDSLPFGDFSRDVLQRLPEELRTLRVPRCGWSDLGTPARLARCLAAHTRHRGPTRHPHSIPTQGAPRSGEAGTMRRAAEQPGPMSSPAART